MRSVVHRARVASSAGSSASRRTWSGGQSLVEFALVVPMFLLIIMALFDVGMFVFTANDISNAARAGARVAIVDQSSGTAENRVIEQAGRGLTTADVDVAYLSSDLSSACSPVELDCIAEVTVRYEWEPILKSVLLLGLIFPDPITVASTTRMPVERIYP